MAVRYFLNQYAGGAPPLLHLSNPQESLGCIDHATKIVSSDELSRVIDVNHVSLQIIGAVARVVLPWYPLPGWSRLSFS